MSKQGNRFKGPAGHYFTKALFWEHTSPEDKAQSIYTLKDEDYKGLPSLKALYLQEDDLTEYSFANKHLGGWKHWCLLKKAVWFQELYLEWRDELEVSLMSQALHQIQKEALSNDSKSSYQANKYLLEQGWIKPSKGGVGRTTKQKILQEANKLFTGKQDVDEDYKRIMN